MVRFVERISLFAIGAAILSGTFLLGCSDDADTLTSADKGATVASPALTADGNAHVGAGIDAHGRAQDDEHMADAAAEAESDVAVGATDEGHVIEVIDVGESGETTVGEDGTVPDDGTIPDEVVITGEGTVEEGVIEPEFPGDEEPVVVEDHPDLPLGVVGEADSGRPDDKECDNEWTDDHRVDGERREAALGDDSHGAVVEQLTGGPLDTGPLTVMTDVIGTVTASLTGDWAGRAMTVDTPSGVSHRGLHVQRFDGTLTLTHEVGILPSPLVLGIHAENVFVIAKFDSDPSRNPDVELMLFARAGVFQLFDLATGIEIEWPEAILGPRPMGIRVQGETITFIFAHAVAGNEDGEDGAPESPRRMPSDAISNWASLKW